VRWIGVGIGAVLLGCVVFFVTDRFRAPAAPLVIALGAGGVMSVVAALRERQWRRFTVFGAVALVVAAVALSNPYHVPARPWIGSYVLAAEAERNRGESVRALAWIDRALEEEPGLYAAQLARVELLRRLGRVPEARGAAESALRHLPEDAALLHELAILQDLSGETEAALVSVERALARDASNESAHITRAIVLARLDRGDDAARALREFLARGPSDAEAARARRVLEGIARGEFRETGEPRARR
jgi:tetratricopeptide (TPR) repeat protein